MTLWPLNPLGCTHTDINGDPVTVTDPCARCAVPSITQTSATSRRRWSYVLAASTLTTGVPAPYAIPFYLTETWSGQRVRCRYNKPFSCDASCEAAWASNPCQSQFLTFFSGEKLQGTATWSGGFSRDSADLGVPASSATQLRENNSGPCGSFSTVFKDIFVGPIGFNFTANPGFSSPSATIVRVSGTKQIYEAQYNEENCEQSLTSSVFFDVPVGQQAEFAVDLSSPFDLAGQDLGTFESFSAPGAVRLEPGMYASTAAETYFSNTMDTGAPVVLETELFRQWTVGNLRAGQSYRFQVLLKVKNLLTDVAAADEVLELDFVAGDTEETVELPYASDAADDFYVPLEPFIERRVHATACHWIAA